MKLNALLALTVVVSASACATLEPRVAATGEPLETRSHEVTILAHFDDNLNWHEKHPAYVFDGFYQGATAIDELDYYSIAGDDASKKKIIAWREARNQSIIVGWAGFGGGAALVGTGLAIVASKTGFKEVPSTDSFGNDPTSQVGLGFVIAGAVLLGGSYFIGELVGPDHGLNEYELVLDPEKLGEAAAETYNAKLGAKPSAPAAP